VLTLKNKRGLEEARVSAKAFTTSCENDTEIPDVGDFDRNQGFSFAHGFRLGKDKSEPFSRRMTIKMIFAAGTLARWPANPRRHIVSKWPEDAIKVSSNKAFESFNRWTHVCITNLANGSAKGQWR